MILFITYLFFRTRHIKLIKNTPILKGKQAINFYKTIELNKDRKVSVDTLIKIRTDASNLKELLKVNRDSSSRFDYTLLS
jgi:hypothetical protein